MKKYTIFAAAFAMLAFASCNKEENINRDAEGNYLITLTSENGQAKAGFEADFNGQLFDATDSILMNGVYRQYNIQTVEGSRFSTEEYSNCIQMAVPVADAEHEIFFLYPGSQFSVDENDPQALPFVEMPGSPVPAISMNRQNLNDYGATLEDPITFDNAWRTINDRVVWPMAGYLPEGVITGHDGNVHFAMKNTTAFLCPNIKFGPSFMSALSQSGMIAAGLYNDYTPMPTLHITKVTFTSDKVLAGIGHVIYQDAEPILMMNEEDGSNELEISVYEEMNEGDVLAYGYNPYFAAATSNSGVGLGIIPVACGNHQIQMVVEFTLTFAGENGQVVYNGVYAGNTVALNMTRNVLYMCNVDLYNGGTNVSKVTLTLAE